MLHDVMKYVLTLIFGAVSSLLFAQQPSAWQGKFEQLGQTLPTPNEYRTGSGAPGPKYWQQRADYEIDVEVNEITKLLTGKEKITYYNNSPQSLSYLWVQLDQNVRSKNGIADLTTESKVKDQESVRSFATSINAFDYDGGFKLTSVRDGAGNALPYVINYTMMRIDLPAPLKSGEKLSFYIDWHYTEYDRMEYDGRGGYEHFPEDDNYAFTFAQWYPRMCVFDDYEGWQNKQFLGTGEFALTFGNFRVRITVPSDHIVGATGWLQNPKDVLTEQQIERFTKAQQTFDNPVFIVTQEEAEKKEKIKSKKKSTWEYYAENVRDFAFAHSRKYIWDAMAVKLPTTTVLAQSLYPKEGNPLWARESTRAIKNTLEVYSQRTFDYPYPTAYSVNSAEQGMEYPMICFNHSRPGRNGTYTKHALTRMLGVIVHEVGHNFFPMIVNSDERQWTWMDEGLNTFLEKETIHDRYPELAYLDGTPEKIVAFMKGEKAQMRPIMGSADAQGRNHGSNGYDKPSAALTVLRENVMGPELFDKAFKEYSQRWMFKQPKPADFFRTMEDASGVDLDWFWRGWFYSTDHVDLTLQDVKWYKLKAEKRDVENKNRKAQQGDLSGSGNSPAAAKDFSEGPSEFELTNTPDSQYKEFLNRLDDNAIRRKIEGKNIYEVTFRNSGGLISPIVIEWTYKDGSKENEIIPAEIWRKNESEVTKVFVKEKEVTNIVIDPNLTTADVNVNDNVFPRFERESKFEQMKRKN